MNNNTKRVRVYDNELGSYITRDGTISYTFNGDDVDLIVKGPDMYDKEVIFVPHKHKMEFYTTHLDDKKNKVFDGDLMKLNGLDGLYFLVYLDNKRHRYRLKVLTDTTYVDIIDGFNLYDAMRDMGGVVVGNINEL